VIEAAGAPERRYRFTLHYDGGQYCGWQVQPDVRTVQGELETALERLTERTVGVIAAGRTDTGVHAVGQVASALLPGHWTAEALERALNAVLPDDIWVAAVEETPLDFHARYDARARGYQYRVGTRPAARSPFVRHWCWPLCRPLDAQLLRDAARLCLGTHSFRAFAKTGQPERGEMCTVLRSEWSEWPGLGFEFRVIANRFLHHMVRCMVGTMADVAQERRPLADVSALLEGDTELGTSPPAPSSGLCLARVYYDAETAATDPLAWTPSPAGGVVPPA
jgi:tRNA pseudouridine38-40 synthase